MGCAGSCSRMSSVDVIYIVAPSRRKQMQLNFAELEPQVEIVRHIESVAADVSDTLSDTDTTCKEFNLRRRSKDFSKRQSNADQFESAPTSDDYVIARGEDCMSASHISTAANDLVEVFNEPKAQKAQDEKLGDGRARRAAMALAQFKLRSDSEDVGLQSKLRNDGKDGRTRDELDGANNKRRDAVLELGINVGTDVDDVVVTQVQRRSVCKLPQQSSEDACSAQFPWVSGIIASMEEADAEPYGMQLPGSCGELLWEPPYPRAASSTSRANPRLAWSPPERSGAGKWWPDKERALADVGNPEPGSPRKRRPGRPIRTATENAYEEKEQRPTQGSAFADLDCSGPGSPRKRRQKNSRRPFTTSVKACEENHMQGGAIAWASTPNKTPQKLSPMDLASSAVERSEFTPIKASKALDTGDSESIQNFLKRTARKQEKQSKTVPSSGKEIEIKNKLVTPPKPSNAQQRNQTALIHDAEEALEAAVQSTLQRASKPEFPFQGPRFDFRDMPLRRDMPLSAMVASPVLIDYAADNTMASSAHPDIMGLRMGSSNPITNGECSPLTKFPATSGPLSENNVNKAIDVRRELPSLADASSSTASLSDTSINCGSRLPGAKHGNVEYEECGGTVSKIERPGEQRVGPSLAFGFRAADFGFDDNLDEKLPDMETKLDCSLGDPPAPPGSPSTFGRLHVNVSSGSSSRSSSLCTVSCSSSRCTGVQTKQTEDIATSKGQCFVDVDRGNRYQKRRRNKHRSSRSKTNHGEHLKQNLDTLVSLRLAEDMSHQQNVHKELPFVSPEPRQQGGGEGHHTSWPTPSGFLPTSSTSPALTAESPIAVLANERAEENQITLEQNPPPPKSWTMDPPPPPPRPPPPPMRPCTILHDDDLITPPISFASPDDEPAEPSTPPDLLNMTGAGNVVVASPPTALETATHGGAVGESAAQVPQPPPPPPGPRAVLQDDEPITPPLSPDAPDDEPVQPSAATDFTLEQMPNISTGAKQLTSSVYKTVAHKEVRLQPPPAPPPPPPAPPPSSKDKGMQDVPHDSSSSQNAAAIIETSRKTVQTRLAPMPQPRTEVPRMMAQESNAEMTSATKTQVGAGSFLRTLLPPPAPIGPPSSGKPAELLCVETPETFTQASHNGDLSEALRQAREVDVRNVEGFFVEFFASSTSAPQACNREASGPSVGPGKQHGTSNGAQGERSPRSDSDTDTISVAVSTPSGASLGTVNYDKGAAIGEHDRYRDDAQLQEETAAAETLKTAAEHLPMAPGRNTLSSQPIRFPKAAPAVPSKLPRSVPAIPWSDYGPPCCDNGLASASRPRSAKGKSRPL